MFTNKYLDANAKARYNAMATRNKITLQNEAYLSNYNSLTRTLSFAQDTNDRLLDEYSNELTRAGQRESEKQKLAIQEEGSKIALTEGVTAGKSKARIIQTFGLKSSEAINIINDSIDSTITKARQQNESQNESLKKQKLSALNELEANLISADQANIMVQSAAMDGYAEGFALGKAKDDYLMSLQTLNTYKK